MPRSNTRRPGIRQIATGSMCLWPCCPNRTSPGRVMDPGCWRRVPPPLRESYRAARAQHGQDSPQCRDVLAQITTWAREQDVAAQEAGAR